MKNLRNSIALFLIVVVTASSQKTISNTLDQKDCLTLKHFNLLKNYVNSKGTIIKTHVGISTNTNDKSRRSRNGMAEMNTGTLEISINDRYLTFTNYKDWQKITIVNNSKDNNIEPYFISNTDNKLKISAYYSRLDTKEIVRTRKEDWCNLIEEIKLLMKFPKNCE